MSLTNTPNANRLHIGIFGKRNSGKSSLFNALARQEVALVSAVAGTTTDLVYKAVELPGIGPCVLIDTAGFDDEGLLGSLRVEKTKAALSRTDIALFVFQEQKWEADLEPELEWLKLLKESRIPVIGILNQSDSMPDTAERAEYIYQTTGLKPLAVDAKMRIGLEAILDAILAKIPEDYDSKSLTEDFVKEGEVVLLVMPQDIQAPKGRLILPQVQTIRDLLDRNCTVISTTTDQMETSLLTLKEAPDIIITDSQVFKQVYGWKPEKSRLTSFSILFAAHKGDLEYYRDSTAAIGQLTSRSKVLIAEACTHAPQGEDIGRVKIPALLRKKAGQDLAIEVVSGADFPSDLSEYDLIIQCGACMFNRKHVLSRIDRAKEQHVPMTNYGIAIAYLTGILDTVMPKGR